MLMKNQQKKLEKRNIKKNRKNKYFKKPEKAKRRKAREKNITYQKGLKKRLIIFLIAKKC